MPEPVDGFTLDPTLRPLVHTAGALQVSVIEELRQAHNFRPRWHVIPSVGAGLPFTLPAREMREYQIRVEPGSWWWGWQAAAFGPGAPFSFNVTEESTGRKLCSDLKLAYMDFWLDMSPFPGGFLPFFTVRRMKYAVNFLGEPWLILEPGLLNVEIYNVAANGFASACQPQVILMMAEPVCAAVREMNPCS